MALPKLLIFLLLMLLSSASGAPRNSLSNSQVFKLLASYFNGGLNTPTNSDCNKAPKLNSENEAYKFPALNSEAYKFPRFNSEAYKIQTINAEEGFKFLKNNWQIISTLKKGPINSHALKLLASYIEALNTIPTNSDAQKVPISNSEVFPRDNWQIPSISNENFKTAESVLHNDEEFEKQIEEYEEIKNKIKELQKEITFLEKLKAKNAKMEAIYAEIIKDYLTRKRNLLFCTMEKKLWHEARLAKLKSKKKLKERQCCLNTQQMKADKFCPEVMEAHKEREFIQQLEEYYYHERSIANGSPFEGN